METGWVFASCDTEHSASAARVKFGQIAPKARSSPAACRCKQTHTFILYHDIKEKSDRMAAHRKLDQRRAWRGPGSLPAPLQDRAEYRVQRNGNGISRAGSSRLLRSVLRHRAP